METQIKASLMDREEGWAVVGPDIIMQEQAPDYRKVCLPSQRSQG